GLGHRRGIQGDFAALVRGDEGLERFVALLREAGLRLEKRSAFPALDRAVGAEPQHEHHGQRQESDDAAGVFHASLRSLCAFVAAAAASGTSWWNRLDSRL